MREQFKGFLDWNDRVNHINGYATPISSAFIFVLNYFHLIPQQISWINYVIFGISLFLYLSIFIAIVHIQLKKHHEANLQQLLEDKKKLQG